MAMGSREAGLSTSVPLLENNQHSDDLAGITVMHESKDGLEKETCFKLLIDKWSLAMQNGNRKIYLSLIICVSRCLLGADF